MVKKQLVAMKVAEGKRLVEALDESDFPVNSALWFLSETEVWRLLLASPVVDSEGPRAAYEGLQDFLNRSSPKYEIALDEVTLLSPRDALIGLLRGAVVTGSGVSEVRFTENSINNVFIEDALIYRIAADPEWTPQDSVAAP